MVSTKYILFLVILLSGINAWSQDIHFTNFQLAPMTLNPALAGSFQGTLRASGIYRDQNNGGYNTIDGGIEYNIPFALRKQDWITIGMEILRDTEEAVDKTNVNTLNQKNITLAYHFAIDKKYRNILTAAFQYKTMSALFNNKDLKLDSDLQGIGRSALWDQFRPVDEKSKGNTLSDYLLAFTWRSKLGKRNTFNTGFSIAHVVRIEKSVIGGGGSGGTKNPFKKIGRDVMPTRITMFGSGEFFINDKMSIQPVVYFQNQGQFSEIVIQSFYGLVFNPTKNIKINPGLGYRIGDAAQFLFVMDYGKFKAGASFDLTASKYKSSLGHQNALEFGVSYTTTIVSKPKVKPVIFCPRM